MSPAVNASSHGNLVRVGMRAAEILEMHHAKLFRRAAISLGVLALCLTSGCSRSVDPDLEQALDELTSLQSACNVSLTYSDFSALFLSAKNNIDAALERTSDKNEIAKTAINRAIGKYQDVRKHWHSNLSNSKGSPLIENRLAEASDSVDDVKRYFFPRGMKKQRQNR
jgi:hypothetical protein